MSYIVLARKYRPQKFDDIVGQEHITELLKKSVLNDRVAHAYLLCGPRGVGKTSCARILAKSLNCEKAPTLTPCGKCAACQEIAKSTSFDVIEIDGASNRGIDEIRTLRENVKFAPNYGRYKIYIVDEVHMLTTEAFNALLKTLEEPPEHVKFIFATTAPNKLPSTIISRCQRFDFKRISPQKAIAILKSIAGEENLQVEDAAFFAIAKAAQGSLRDSLSILDQLSALSDRRIVNEDVCSMLGLVETDLLFELADALGDKNCQAALQILDTIINAGKDIKQLGKDVVEHFRNLMIIKVGGKALGKLVDYPVAIKEMLLAQTDKFTLKEILAALETLIEAQDVARITESLRMPLEVAFAKITYTPGAEDRLVNPAAAAPQAQRPAQERPQTVLVKSMEVLKNQKGQIDLSPGTGEHSIEEPQSSDNDTHTQTAEAPAAVDVLDVERIRKAWDAITYAISKERMSVATFLQEGSPFAFDSGKLTIGFPENAVFHKESLESKDIIHLVERNFSDKLRQQIRIELKIIQDFKPNDDEPLVQNALNLFKGKVVNKWHSE
jgi:DNA polymerase-3 subunit gamma/tau